MIYELMENNINIILYIILSIFIILIFGLYLNILYKIKNVVNKILRLLTTFLIFGGLIIILNQLFYNYTLDNFIILLILIFYIFYLSSINIEESIIKDYEFFVILLMSLLGMIGIILSKDFIILFLSLELMSLSGYILASLKKDSEQSIEAGLKYFILGSLGTGILVLGVTLLYGYLGVINYSLIKLLLMNPINEVYWLINNDFNINYLFGILFITIGLLLKIGSAPYHMWLPDVYEGSIMIITSYFAIIPKIALFSILIKLNLVWLVNGQSGIEIVFIFCSLLSMIIGSIGALGQLKIKRLIGYSSISHIGYILMGLSTGYTLGLGISLFYLIIYLIMNLVLFSIILSIKSEYNELKYIKDLKGFSKKNPFMAFCLSLVLLSMAGIPPFAGFLSKYYIFSHVLEMKMYLLFIVGVITSVISTFYYLSIIKTMYFEEGKIENLKIILTELNSYIIIFGVLFLTIYILNADILINIIQNILL